MLDRALAFFSQCHTALANLAPFGMPILGNIFVSLLVAIAIVPLASRIKLGAVVGYIIAGIVVGPYCLDLGGNVEEVMAFSEFGVVLMLFLIGLELDLRRLWQMRLPVLGGGSLQMVACAIPIALFLHWAGLRWPVAILSSLTLAMSSTAVWGVLVQNSGLAGTPVADRSFSILLFQDLAAIPLIAAVPIIGVARGAAAADGGWMPIAQCVGAVLALVIGGRFLAIPVMRYIAGSGVKEVFTAFSLCLVAGISWMMEMVGLSAASGAFVAGVLLATSGYRSTIEADMAPVKDLLLGLFFISVGMTVDLKLVAGSPIRILVSVVALLTVKTLVLMVIGRVMRLRGRDVPLFAAMLSQGGEFAFVVFSLCATYKILPPGWIAILMATVAISMGTTPAFVTLLKVLDARIARWRGRRAAQKSHSSGSSAAEGENRVVVVGYGDCGRTISRVLTAAGAEVCVLDSDPMAVAQAQKNGCTAHYGDLLRGDFLESAGVGTAKLVVLSGLGAGTSVKAARLLMQAFPSVPLMAIAQNSAEAVELQAAGVSRVRTQAFESALRASRDILVAIGMSSPYEAKLFADTYRRNGRELLNSISGMQASERREAAIASRSRFAERFKLIKERFLQTFHRIEKRSE